MPKSDEPDELPEKSRRSPSSFLSYHSRECSICRHPERDRIDQEFVEWGAVGSIAAAYRIQRRAIYRHAHATNLFERRNRDLRFALGRIIEQAQTVQVTADSIVRAVRLYACLNDGGEWIGPPTRSMAVRRARRAPAVCREAEVAASQSPDPARAPDSADENARSTHPNDQTASQLIGNTPSQPAQIDTISTPSRSLNFSTIDSKPDQGISRSSDDERLFQHRASSVQPPETQV